ncbi:MAG: VTT domain-containing protein [Minisyncoccia bacterium]
MIEHLGIYNFILDHQTLGYLLAFFFMVIEGDTPLFIFGFLAQQGLFDFSLVFLFLYSGAVIGDVGWYLVGRSIPETSLIARWANRLASPLDHHVQNNPAKTIFFSKFIYGIHHAIWVRAGLIKAPLRHLVKIDLFSSAVWVLVIGGLGYISSASLYPIGKYTKYAELLMLAVFVGFFILQHYLAKLSKKNI